MPISAFGAQTRDPRRPHPESFVIPHFLSFFRFLSSRSFPPFSFHLLPSPSICLSRLPANYSVLCRACWIPVIAHCRSAGLTTYPSPSDQHFTTERSQRSAMAVARPMRRTSPITLLLAALLAFGFLCFLLSPSPSASASASAASVPITDSSQQLREDAAQNPLSPPTKPFFKEQPVRQDGVQAPPPVVHYNLNSLTSTDNAAGMGERVLILTPLARFYPEFWANVEKLSYPHALISIGFIVPRTKDGNTAVAALEEAIAKTQNGPVDSRFASISILRQDFDPPLQSQDEKERHKMANQKARRESMSRARNSLVFTTLGPSTSWVLWLDADIVETPRSLIQDLTRHDKPVIVPNCFQRYYNADTKRNEVRPYDFNSWIDSSNAQALADAMEPDDILLEGYYEMPTYRSLMAYMADQTSPDPKREIELDGVGGTALMVKADVHRDGAMFPAFPFYHLVETEGFAKMAKRLGYSVFGLPDYFVSCLPVLFEEKLT